MNRRTFIKGSLIPFIARPAWALAPSDKVHKHYLGFLLYGAPERWSFDMPLALHQDETPSPHPMVINTRNTQGAWVYKTTEYKKWRVPEIWNRRVPSANGWTRPISLLDHTHIVRGVDVKFNDHPVAAGNLMARAPGSVTFTGLLADATPYLFNHLALGSNPITRSFVSPKGDEGVTLNEEPDEIMEFLLKPFGQTIRGLKEDGDFESMLSLLGVIRAKEPSKVQIKRILAHYKDALSRYTHLAEQALRATYPGINDRPIESKLVNEVDGKKSIEESISDFYIKSTYYTGPDLRQCFKKASLERWPAHFAFAETIVKFELCNNLVLSPPNECGRSLNDLDFGTGPDLSKTTARFENGRTFFSYSGENINDEKALPLDSHDHGRIPTFYGNALFYAAMSACLLELVTNLKGMKHSQGGSAFEQTLIHLSAEFGRIPSLSRPESEHDPRSHVSTFISGMIPRFHVTGDIVQEFRQNGANYGTFGAGVAGGLNYGNVMTTVAEMMGIKSLIPSGTSLVKADGKKYFPVRPMGRMV